MQEPIRKLDHDVTLVFRCCYECHRVEFYPRNGGSFCTERKRHGEYGKGWDHERCYLKNNYDESATSRSK